MTIITLSRQLSSRGDEIALAVAERLHLRLIGRELVNRAASLALAPEVALFQIDELGLLGIRPSATAIQQYKERITEVITEFAAQDDLLLVGRGGQVVLAGDPNVLRVRVIAPMTVRISSMRAESGISESAARARIDASDEARNNYHRRIFGVRPDDPGLYDLVINTAEISIQVSVEIICVAALAKRKAARTP